MMLSIDDFKARLESFLTDELDKNALVTNMTPLAGGASRDSWAISVDAEGDLYQFVVRRDLPTNMSENALTREEEYRLMDLAYQSGVKVAQVRWHSNNPEILEMPFFVMDFVEGISIGRKVITEPALEGARQVLPEHMAEQLALIHKMDASTLDFLPRPPEGLTPAHEAVNQMYAVLDSLGVNSPPFEFALRWAAQHLPYNPDITFVHGDFRIGNLLVDQNGLAAVIDWEFSHIGDPNEEIGYLCMRDWRFGNDHLHAGGLCERERFIRAYEGFSGRTVDRSAVDWWEIVGNIRWGIICLAQADRHLSGKDPSVELASLGRRSAEMQLEALRLIEKVGY